MTMRTFIAGVALLTLAACTGAADNVTAPAAPIAAVKPPAGTEWTTTVVATPDGGFQMGNPNAALKLIEYGSLTCSHCAEFSAQGAEALKTRYVATGKVSYEFRSYLLQGRDIGATMVVQCGGPGAFFTMLEQTYAAQRDWATKLFNVPQAEQQRQATLPIDQQIALTVSTSGLDTFAAERGIGRDQLNKCLADKALPEKLNKMRERADTEFNLTGTPTFILNGATLPDTSSWDRLEPRLKAAGA